MNGDHEWLEKLEERMNKLEDRVRTIELKTATWAGVFLVLVFIVTVLANVVARKV